MNTVRNRVCTPVDTLTSTADLTSWLVAAGLLADLPVEVVTPLVDSMTLDQARGLRSAVEDVLAGPVIPAEAVFVLDRWAGLAPHDRLIRNEDGSVRVVPADPPVPDVRGALALIAADVIALVRTGGLAGVKTCAHDRCGLRFQDRTPRATRRWCSMRRCGNRAKVSRHAERARYRGGPAGGAGP